MEINEQKIKGIIFDLDGTLYSLKGFNTQIAWRSLRHLRLFLRMVQIRYSLRGVDLQNKENFYAQFFNKFSLLAKKDLSTLQDWYFDAFYPTFIKLLNERFRLRPPLKVLLEKLKKNSIKTAILSDYAYVKERLEALQVDPEYFDILASNEDYGVLKPSGRPLLAIAGLLGIKPDEALVIGDRSGTDGRGALLAGMPFINVNKISDFNKFYRQMMKF